MDETRKTPDYIRRNVKKYIDNHDRVIVTFDKGTNDRIKRAAGGVSMAAWCKNIILRELDRIEHTRDEEQGTG